jgi:hypothetical protein
MKTLALIWLSACGKHDSLRPVDPICPGENAWTKGTNAFEEGTEDWGLTGVEGVRVEAIDFDGDGWPDLHVHRGGNEADDFHAGGVRQSWLLRNDHAGHFVDVTEASGFRQTRAGTDPKIGRGGSVLAWGDVDDDGDLDAYTGLTNLDGELTETSETMINNGDGTFSLGPKGSDLRRSVDESPAGAAFLDWDRDGDLDLFVGQNSDASYFPLQDQLYEGANDGGFSRATTRAGLTTLDWRDATAEELDQGLGHSNAWSALACDLNGDGREDLMAASYGRAPNLLWMQLDDGTFENQGVASGYAYDDRTDWSDNESARCYCKLHPTADDCPGVPLPTTVCETDADVLRWNPATDREAYRLGGNNGTTVCADVDNDGDMDLLQTDIVHWDVGSSSDPSELLLNDGAGRFDRPGNEVTGLTREHDTAAWNDGDMTAAIFDFDNDAWPDVYIGSSDYPGDRGLLWHQDSPGHFETVPPKVGIDHMRSHGIAVADFDRDGDLDVVVGHSFARCDSDCYPTQNVRLFLNQMGGNFVQLRLDGTNGSNRSAIGARVTVTAGGVTQTHEIGGGHGHYGIEDDLVQHFGLGSACEANVSIRWPDAAGSVQRFGVQAGHRYRILTGAPPILDDPE